MNEFPHGKLSEDDEGAIACSIESIEGENGTTVVIRFAKPVAWFGMDKRMTRDFAFTLLRASGVKIEIEDCEDGRRNS